MIAAMTLAGPAHAMFGVERFETSAAELGGAPSTQAGSHPYVVTFLPEVNHEPPSEIQKEHDFTGEVPDGEAKNIKLSLPAGLIVNLLGVARCTETELARQKCPLSSQVGVVTIKTGLGALNGLNHIPVYNLVPASANVPGELGFIVLGEVTIHIVGAVQTGGDYALGAKISGISQIPAFDGARLTLWGDPSAASHDTERCLGVPCSPPVAVERTERPFLRLPTSCPTEAAPLAALPSSTVEELTGAVTAESWQEPGIWTPPVRSSPPFEMGGCEQIGFTPSIEVTPEKTAADTPTGVGVKITIPQRESLESPAEADLKETVVTLPPGVSVSPSAADGLGACSEAEIDLSGPAEPSCPESSKIALVEARTPLLERPLQGAMYLAQQGNMPGNGSNPFGSLIAMYLVLEGSGVLFKAAGEVQLDQSTGQLTARFGRDPTTGFYLPQVPISELEIGFFGGPRAALATPAACGTYVTTTQMTPWSAPASGPPAKLQSGWEVDSGCATGAFNPVLRAGTTSNTAGTYSPFVVTFSRHDAEQEVAAVQVHAPPGLLGMLSKVPLCGEPQAQEGRCGEASILGTVSATAGLGTDPLSVTGGRMYLTGPYRGAPFGLSFVVPARAGPFDLGDVVVRAAISIDPTTSAVTITSDPLPRIIQGVPLQIRSITADVNRPEFMFNPTNCERMSIAATVQGAQSASPQVSVPFQATGCAGLKFAPKFVVSTSGRTSKAEGASLDTKVTYSAGSQGSYANIRSVKVELPKQLPARLSTLQKACVAATFEADPAACPAGSVVGVVRATTPLLPVALGGPAYFVSYGGAKFPELIIILQGDGVRVDLHGATFISKAGITSSTFKSIPDVPVRSFELYLPRSRGSALAANGDLCREKLVMPTVITAQNGAVIHQATRIAVSGCPKTKKATAAGGNRVKRARTASRRQRDTRSGR
jgi:hypothetical protein